MDRRQLHDSIEHCSGCLLVLEKRACFQSVKEVFITRHQDASVLVDLEKSFNEFPIDIVECVEALWGGTFKINFLICGQL